LNRLIEEVVELYRTDDGRIVMNLELDPRLPLLFADPNRLRQLLNNLVKNAIEAQNDKPNSVVRVSTRLAQENLGDYLEMRIEDRGNGIPVDMLSQVFEPYVTNKPKGTGLGLPIVKKIVEEHGGIVWMENNAAGGASAVIRLPVAEVETGGVAVAAARRPA
jgi:nitrogen fixation/metabolism regulation signal transduction histidine kinase